MSAVSRPLPGGGIPAVHGVSRVGKCNSAVTRPSSRSSVMSPRALLRWQCPTGVYAMSLVMTFGTWLGIAACLAQSALFAGLNLAVFSLSLLRLQIEADGGNKDAARVLDLRRSANQILATIIWGNVTTNVLLTLLSDSVLAGIGAFVF